MKTTYILILAAFFASFALILIILPILKRLKAGQYILGYVTEHKGKNGTPTMGGLAIIGGIIIVALCYYSFSSGIVNVTLAITAAFVVVGFLDDFLKLLRRENEGLKPYQKIIFQLAIATIAAVYCYINKLTFLYIPFMGGKSFNISWGIIPLVIFIFIATVNCVNLTDGLDGLAGGTSCAYLCVLGLILLAQNSALYSLAFLSVGAVAAFLVFNVNKAKLFMGDTGSLSIGGLISCLSVFSGNSLYIPFVGIMFVISGISVILQVIYYKRTRRRIFLMAPLHHHLQMKGNTECAISYVYFLITALVGIVCLIFV
jgi:phospho-N-acetylmuramoyl-pentapeptide-transferase